MAFEKILVSLKRRLSDEVSPRNPLKYLNDVDFEDHINDIVGTVYLYTRPKKGTHPQPLYLTETICALGRKLLSRESRPKDTSLAAKTGAFILYTFEELGYIRVSKSPGGRGRHATYTIEALDDDAIQKMWAELPPATIQKIPSITPYADWEGYRHETGALLVKTNHKIRKTLKPETHPLVFEAINRSQKVGWRINPDIYELHLWAFRNKARAFDDIWNAHSGEARATKMRETRAISNIAARFLHTTFWHMYYYDFRGRKYVATAYLNEQGSDLAKGLLLREDKKAIGRGGFFWMCVSIASNWAGDAGREDGAKTDKIPLKDRQMWVLDNEEIIVAYAENPKINQGWMQADKPWQFLAACLEFLAFRIHQAGDFNDYSYESSLEAYVDGTNNGSQHLSALMLDEVTAPHVNLVPSELPGDLYMFVADHLWVRLANAVREMTPKAIRTADTCIDTIIDMKKQISQTEPRSELRKELVEKLMAYREKYRAILVRAAPVFWLRIEDAKHKRKIVKRGTMTLPYGAKPYGLGEQVIGDCRKHGIELLMHMEHSWGAYLGRELFSVCEACLERPMRLLSTFENAGKRAEDAGEFLSWTVPITNFPVVQHYVEGEVKKTWVQYGAPFGKKKKTGYFENTLQLSVSYLELPIPSKRKQAQGASPNAIHSLDAAHLVITSCRADFPVTTVHDSFGALLGDVDGLYTGVREAFLELYRTDPLSRLFEDMDIDMSGLNKGKLNLSLILDSEYCFS